MEKLAGPGVETVSPPSRATPNTFWSTLNPSQKASRSGQPQRCDQ